MKTAFLTSFSSLTSFKSSLRRTLFFVLLLGGVGNVWGAAESLNLVWTKKDNGTPLGGSYRSDGKCIIDSDFEFSLSSDEAKTGDPAGYVVFDGDNGRVKSRKQYSLSGTTTFTLSCIIKDNNCECTLPTLTINGTTYKQNPTTKTSTVNYETFNLTYEVTATGTFYIEMAFAKSDKFGVNTLSFTSAGGETNCTYSYNINGGTGTTPSGATVTSGTAITLAASSGFSYEGKAFDGWKCSADNKKYTAGASYTVNSNVTFTAQWKNQGGGGTCTNTKTFQCETDRVIPTSGTAAPGTLKTIPVDEQPYSEYSGYHGDGYIDFKNGSGEIYFFVHLPNSTYSFETWLCNSNNAWINIYSTSGSGDQVVYNNVTYKKQTNKGISHEKPFGSDTYSGVELSEGDYLIGLFAEIWTAYDQLVITAASDVFCEEPTTFTVNVAVDPAGYGSVSPSSVTDVASGTAVSGTGTASSGTLTINTNPVTTVTATPATQTAEYSYSFTSWSGIPESGKVTENCTITANFSQTARTYSVTYHLNNGEWNGDAGAATYTYGTGIETLATNVQRSGYTFLGWRDNAELEGDAVTSIATNATGDKNLYAKWQLDKSEFTVTYHPGTYGSGTITAGTKQKDVTFTLSSSTFTRDYYAQTGWSTTDGGEKAYDLGGSYTTNADITLYPFWTANTYNITYNLNEGDWSGTEGAATYTYGVGIPTLADNVTRTNFSFLGWYDNSALTGEPVTSISTTDHGDKEFWAKWGAINAVTVTIGEHGTSVSGQDNYVQGASVTLEASAATNYRFKNWSNVTGVSLSAQQLTANPLTFTMPANAVSMQANFEFDAVENIIATGTETNVGTHIDRWSASDHITISSVKDPTSIFNHKVLHYAINFTSTSDYSAYTVPTNDNYKANSSATGYGFWYYSDDNVYMEFNIGGNNAKVIKLEDTEGVWKYYYVADASAATATSGFEIWMNYSKDNWSMSQLTGNVYFSEIQATNVTARDPKSSCGTCFPVDFSK